MFSKGIKCSLYDKTGQGISGKKTINQINKGILLDIASQKIARACLDRHLNRHQVGNHLTALEEIDLKLEMNLNHKQDKFKYSNGKT
jgi:hypothetical protein